MIPSAPPPKGVEILPASEQDTGEILALFAEHRFALQKREWLDWKYRADPYGQAQPYKVICDGRLEGVGALQPRLFHYQGRRVYGLQAVDGLIRPVARGRGLFNALTTFLGRQTLPETGADAFVFSFASVPASKKSLQYAGWKLLAGFEVYSCILRPDALRDKPMLRPVAVAAAPLWPLVRRFLTRGASPEIEVEEVARFPHGVNEQFSDRRVHGDRSSEFMNWRVCDNPMDRMVTFYLKRRDRFIGYAVGKLRDRRLEIVEMKLDPAEGGSIAALLSHVWDRGTIDTVDYFALGANGRLPALSGRGFFRRRHGGAMFVAHLGRAGLPSDPALWDVTYLDSDW